MTTGTLRVERHDAYVLATLDRPERRNAIDQATIDDLHALCAELEATPATLILAGAGGVFAGGADIAQLRERRATDALRGINATAFARVHALPMPVIAALEGFALGGGAELAFAADIRVAAPTLRIGNPEPGLGIMAAAGATWRLPEIAGYGVAADLLLTARILDADEALRLGLVSRVVDDPLAEAIAIAEQIAALDAAAIQATKRALAAPRADHPRIDGEEQSVLFESPEKERRMTEFLERRARR
ncbi:enoyl-CoA hydratase/isomerase family protein [Agrococcus sp. SGAir0287]|uniref:enoyl-CoA hydratase/isomerase family protein n=1 Tax=Agrococcus sp. SGAir0287 TaxID=2070347 RepID=UPI0010CD1538|nr:enoyl-CoA hydratase/isomerase family protein [Agrococcus sp. SGAir0287]QCR20386.1 enoyl-CoA hydratase [Agrococcus sp. SGAir0287]